MVTDRALIDSFEAGVARLDGASGAEAPTLVVAIRSSVPPWLGDLVDAATLTGATVVVEVEPPSDLVGEALDGWEIGVCTAALTAGAADVAGVDRRRVARVRAVVDALAASTHVPAAAAEEPVS